jgi:hypothetical protein
MHSVCTAHGHAGVARLHCAGAAHERGPRPRWCSAARPRPAQCVRPSSAGQRSARRGASAHDAHSGAVRGGGVARLPHGGALTDAWETTWENVARLTGVWTAARHDGVDDGVGWHGDVDVGVAGTV